LLNNENEIKDNNGKAREDLWWHFPHNADESMQSALRHGDYKLYKNLIPNTYELYRLYKNGKREDLEEKFDIASKSPEVVKDLSARLEKYLQNYGAQLPYKNPLKFKSEGDNVNVASVPVIDSDSFDASSHKVSIKLKKGNSKVIECYVLVKIVDKVRVKKNGKKRKQGKHSKTYIKVPAESSENNLEYTFNIPKEATEYGVLLIDENRFMVKGEFHEIN
jgi:hypothetical protein